MSVNALSRVDAKLVLILIVNRHNMNTFMTSYKKVFKVLISLILV